MANRRAFLAGMLATGFVSTSTWAEVGSPAFLSAARRPDGIFVLCGLTARGEVTFEHPLPARGHAAAAHPQLAQAVAFARRPGTFAVVLDCQSGKEIGRLTAPEGSHFYGHGAYSAAGDVLFTTENDYDAGRGVIGVWDTTQGYRRVGAFGSGGVGPHDIKLMPDGSTLVVANGGIETHPDTGRAKLNLATMRSNLSYLDTAGQVLEQMELSTDKQRNSIRHLAVSDKGAVAFAMQWEGDLRANLPLLGVHKRGARNVRFADVVSVRQMQGYLGSVAMSLRGSKIATTSPRSGRLVVVDFEKLDVLESRLMADVCGVAPAKESFLVTTGTGLASLLGADATRHALQWDNHLIAL